MKRMLAKKPKEPIKSVVDMDRSAVKTPSENKELLLAASMFHQGPLPTPESLLRYDKVCPGAADRIIRMAEKEQDNIHEIRKKDSDSLRLGIILGFISFLLLVMLTFSAIYYDKPWVAAVLVAAVSFCGLFIRKKNDKTVSS